MRILLDECADPRVRSLFPNQQVSTVHEMGWDSLQDGPDRRQLNFPANDD
jgi:predicted nuclease of predicted toxin-antitoxin system